MTEWELEEAADEVGRARRRTVEAAALAVVAGALIAPAAFLWPQLVAPLAAGAGIETLLVAFAWLGRKERIARLALEPEAYLLPEVERYGRRLAEPRERARLAASISRVVLDAHLPGNFYLAERVTMFARDLEALARELLRPTARIEPTSVVACHRLLTRAVESPLYNPRLPAEDLERALVRIRAGVAP